MKTLTIVFFNLFYLALFFPAMAQHAQIPKLENPVSVEYLKANLSKKSPKLILTPAIEKEIKLKLKSDILVQNYYSYLKKQADSILEKPLLKHELEGFRMLAVSREMVERMGVLCMVYRYELIENCWRCAILQTGIHSISSMLLKCRLPLPLPSTGQVNFCQKVQFSWLKSHLSKKE